MQQKDNFDYIGALGALYFKEPENRFYQNLRKWHEEKNFFTLRQRDAIFDDYQEKINGGKPAPATEEAQTVAQTPQTEVAPAETEKCTLQHPHSGLHKTVKIHPPIIPKSGAEFETIFNKLYAEGWGVNSAEYMQADTPEEAVEKQQHVFHANEFQPVLLPEPTSRFIYHKQGKWIAFHRYSRESEKSGDLSASAEISEKKDSLVLTDARCRTKEQLQTEYGPIDQTKSIDLWNGSKISYKEYELFIDKDKEKERNDEAERQRKLREEIERNVKSIESAPPPVEKETPLRDIKEQPAEEEEKNSAPIKTPADQKEKIPEKEQKRWF